MKISREVRHTFNLEPCPFCGGKPRMYKEESSKPYRFTHTCKGNRTQLHIYSSGYSTKLECVTAWNRREN